MIYVDCNAETSDLFVRSVRYEEGVWHDFAELIRLPVLDASVLVDAVLDESTTVGVVGQSSLTIYREQRGAFARFVEITRQP